MVRRPGPVRNSPLAFVLREDLPDFLGPLPADAAALDRLPAAAREVAAYLEARGASFLTDIGRGTKRMPSEVSGAQQVNAAMAGAHICV